MSVRRAVLLHEENEMHSVESTGPTGGKNSLFAVLQAGRAVMQRRNSMKPSPLARTGRCEGFETEPTQTLVNAIYACANEQVLPLMVSMDDLLLFDIKGDGTGVALSTLWLGKSICLLFACRLVLAMTNVVARDSYYNVIGEALYEMTERLREANSQRGSKDFEWANTEQFMDLVLSVEAHLFHHGKFRYVCSPTNELMKFDGQGRYPICIDTQHLWKAITSATGVDVVCYFKQAPEQLPHPITTRSIETLLDYLRKERHHERLKYEPDPQNMNALASGSFGAVYTRLLNRTLPSETRVAEKIINTEKGSAPDKYDHGMEDDHVREIVILNLEPVRNCKFMAKLLDVVVDPITHQIHLYMPWRISLKQYMTEMYHKNAVENGTTHPMEVVKSMTCQMLVALEVLYNLNIAHRDLKPQNILVSYDQFQASKEGGTKEGERWIEITDLGMARQVDPDMKNTGRLRHDYITLWYRSPEALAVKCAEYERVHQASDIWSVGCILYQLATGDVLFPLDKPGAMRQHILMTLDIRKQPEWEKDEHPLKGVFTDIVMKERYYYPESKLEAQLAEQSANSRHMDKDKDKGGTYKDDLAVDIRKMLTLDCTQRPTATDLLRGPNKLLILKDIDNPETTRF